MLGGKVSLVLRCCFLFCVAKIKCFSVCCVQMLNCLCFVNGRIGVACVEGLLDGV